MTAHENPKWIEIHALLTLDCIIQIAYMCVGDFFSKLARAMENEKGGIGKKTHSVNTRAHTILI